MNALLKLHPSQRGRIDPKTAREQIRAVTEAVAQGKRVRFDPGPSSKEIEQEAFGKMGNKGGGGGSTRGGR